MGLLSVLLAATVSRFREVSVALATVWQTYPLVAASIGGLIQSALSGRPAGRGMPVIDATEPAVATVVGMTLLGENLRLGWPMGALAATGAALTLTGVSPRYGSKGQ